MQTDAVVGDAVIIRHLDSFIITTGSPRNQLELMNLDK